MAGPEPLLVEGGRHGLSLDAFLGGRLMLLQPEAGYRAGLDAVLLAATAPVSDQENPPVRIADLGSGVGTVGLCVAARLPASAVVLVEREPELVSIARKNISRNGLDARAQIIAADIEAPAAVLIQAGLAADSFDHVLANPPYQTWGEGRLPSDPLKARSHVMPSGGIERWARACARLVKPGGTAAMIHRADALPEILAAFAGRFGAQTILPVHPRAGEAAVRVIVAGRKGSRAPARLLSGIVVHDNDGHGFAPLLEAVLRRGAGLDLWQADAPRLVPA
jgi:tRNA1(Val) A37 N6-methylase TrmN6